MLTVYLGKHKSKSCTDIKFVARKLLWKEYLCEMLMGVLEKMLRRMQTRRMVYCSKH
jgi:hypothetical protein